MVGILLDLTLGVIPLLALVAEDPLFSIVAVVISFVLFEINLLAIVAVLLILKGFGAKVT
jgi:hypothetical protein